MNPPKRRKCTDIPLMIESNLKYVKGVTRYTTCADVIKMVIKKSDGCRDENQSEAFGIYESSRGIERLLPAKCRILKVIRSWGADDDYNLVFRKVNTTFAAPKITDAKRRKLINRHRGAHVGTLSDLNEMKKCQNKNDCNFMTEIYLTDAENCKDMSTPRTNKHFCESVSSAKMNNLSSANKPDMSRNVTGQSDSFGLVLCKNVTFKYNVNDVKIAVRKTLKTKQFKTDNRAEVEAASTRCRKTKKENVLNLKRHEKLANHVVSKVSRMHQKDGKEALLQKYFADYITFRSPQRTYLDSRYRERGDGAESSLDSSIRCKAGGSNVRPVSSRLGDEENVYISPDVSSDSGQEDELSGLDTAFILNQSKDEFESTFEYQVPHVSPCEDYDQGNSNVETRPRCPGNRLVDYSFSEEDSITTDGGNDANTSSDYVHDSSSVSDVVKSAFSVNKDEDEDDEMESFMRTKLFDETSDEGLSSFDSDDEQEIMV